MRYRAEPRPRRGALAVEAAVVYPVFFLLLLGLIVGGLGVFRYQQVACQAREAARYVCVRGLPWQRETGGTSPTQAQVRQDVVLPLALGMDPQQLAVQIQWIDGASGAAVAWDTSPKSATGMTTSGAPVTNRVRVTVTFRWLPERIFVGPVTFQSVAEVPLAF
jgi:Flp pilus assembly protein TadG